MSNMLSQLQVDPAQHTFFLVDSPTADAAARQKKLIELFFETYGTSGLCMRNSAVLASAYCSRESALVIDIGGDNTFVTPVCDGFNLSTGAKHQRVGGETVTREFDRFLRTNKPNILNLSFMRRRGNLNCPAYDLARLELCRDVKESIFKVAKTHSKMFVHQRVQLQRR